MAFRTFHAILLCAAVIAVTLASTAGASHPRLISATGSYGMVKVRDKFDPGGGTPIEGYVSFVVIRKVRSERIVLRAEPPFHGTLRKGSYRVSSYMQTCDGNCGILDRPSNRCAAPFTMKPGATNTITVLRRADRPCQFVLPTDG